MKLRAVIFDFDGVIVNTEPLHYNAFQEVLAKLGLGFGWEEYESHFLGYDDRDTFREHFKREGRAVDEQELGRLVKAKALAFQGQVERKGAEPYDGALDLIKTLSNELPLALCSGALPSDILPILKRLDMDHIFQVVVTAQDVAASKPDPASYRLTVERLKKGPPGRLIVPSQCVAIEDSPWGIKAAHGADLKVVAVANSYPAERLDKADWVVESLSKVSLQGLENLIR